MLFGSRDVCCVRSQRSTPGYAVADLERLHLWADRSDHARAFLAGNEWQRRAQTAVAELSIDGIHSRDVDLDDCLGSLRLRWGYLGEFHYFGPASVLHPDCFHDGPFVPLSQTVVIVRQVAGRRTNALVGSTDASRAYTGPSPPKAAAQN